MDAFLDVKNQMLNRIDTSDSVEVSKVERYYEFLLLNEELNQAIEADGPTVEIHNGTQHFIKAHPAITEKIKLSSQLAALEKTIKFKEKKKIIKSESKKEKDGLI